MLNDAGITFGCKFKSPKNSWGMNEIERMTSDIIHYGLKTDVCSWVPPKTCSQRPSAMPWNERSSNYDNSIAIKQWIHVQASIIIARQFIYR